MSRAPASLGHHRTRSTHEFYRYPARFAPEVARAAISAFTESGEVVLDPFVGGGTTLVESRLAGRVGIGSDVNELATFVARIKSTPYRESVLSSVASWATQVQPNVNLQRVAAPPDGWIEDGYLRNVDGPEFWRLRKFIALLRQETDVLESQQAQEFVRCAVLRTAQWALDMRSTIPSIPEFRSAFAKTLDDMVAVARVFSKAVRSADRQSATICSRRSLIVTGRAQDLPSNPRVTAYDAPRLVLTSPPYPGVYVLYHRWKVQSRRETPVPYWIADRLDGKGQAHYTMSARTEPHLTKYFNELCDAFQSIASLCDQRTLIVQVVGFSDPDSQFVRYRETMEAAGLREVFFSECATERDGRLWRDVPGRRWWTRGNAIATAKEVVLFHRLR
jgi:hypothetical protein